MSFREVVKSFYVVVASLCLVLAFARWFHGAEAIDPLVAAQNSRIRFQTAGETSNKYSGLTADEVSLAESVLAKERTLNGQQAQLLYIGNSQTIAIMDRAPGDMISPQWLQVLLARRFAANSETQLRPVNVNLGSLPNLSAPELLVRLIEAGERSPRQVDILVASIVLEEFRGLGIRDAVAREAEKSEVSAQLRLLADQNSDLATIGTSLKPLLNADNSSFTNLAAENSSSSYARRLENRLQGFADHIPLFSQRDDLRIQVALGYHEFRNHLLGITSASQRPVPESSYRASLQMLELALRYAKANNIKVVLYLAPIRPIEPNPNLPSDVARFRRDVPELCKRYGVQCLDYVDLVPEAMWTNYPDDAVGSEGQRDFAHFTGAGHRLLAERLLTDMGEQLNAVSQLAKNQ